MTYRLPAILAAGVATLLLSACAGPSDDASPRETAPAAGVSEENGEPVPEGAESPEPTESTEPESAGNLADLPAGEVARLMGETVAALESVRMSGTADIGEEEPMLVDVHFDREGNCVGTSTFAEGRAVEYQAVPGKVWSKPNREFWAHMAGGDEEFLSEIEGKYFLETGNTDLTAFCTLDRLFDEDGSLGILADLGHSMGETDVHNGIPVVTLLSEGVMGTTTTLVAAEAPHHPLLMVGPEGAVALELSDFDVPVEVSPPPAHMIAN
ncbi:hypothetical protein GCM10027160_14250 [Streptomyces calidiresistens]|uniref:Lipoprotein n=1 Tax=Streptomyces calidiresistens TaxID=1485586 RepID=A0A7W3XYU1_9ACTN|nr:hypothetical protein [Streptomyces calidiresistens]MBB0232176.1 hypothetical protein [Streptomyces calidiresistens]